MADKFPGFMRLDLTKLTLSGWLLMLLTLGVVLAAFVVPMLVVNTLGIAVDGRNNRWAMVVLLIVAFTLGGGFFEGGKRVLNHLGLRILRP
jgi:hypothetical protein